MATERAIFAGGCFWCMVQPFEEREGILSVISGYTGGTVENPTYEQVKKTPDWSYRSSRNYF